MESLGLDTGTLRDREELDVRLESEEAILLEAAAAAATEASSTGDGLGGDS